MIHTSRDTEPNSERFFLIETVKSHGTHEIVARVVRKAAPHQYNDEGRCVKYQDSAPKEANGYRNATWSKSNRNGLYVDDFGLVAFLGDGIGTPKLRVYGVDLCFSNAYRVDAETTTQMGKTFSSVHKNLQKQDAAYGYLDGNDYAGRLRRLAVALGITQFLTYNNQTDSLETSTFDIHTTLYLNEVIDALVKRAQK